MRKIVFCLCTVFLWNACAPTRKEYQISVKLSHLDKSSLYNKDLVYNVIFDAEELNVDSLKMTSRLQFLKAIDLCKNKNKPREAIALFKKSILTFPDAKTYYELGNALLEGNPDFFDLEEALDAYNVAEHLSFQPSANVLVQKGIANFLIYQKHPIPEDKEPFFNKSLWLFNEAFDKGFNDTLLLNKDPRLQGLVKREEYRDMLKNVLLTQKNRSSSVDTTKGGLFDQFKKSFSSLSEGQFTVALDNVELKDHHESITYDFASYIPEMENASFGRDVSHDFEYVGKLMETPQFTAVIYKSIAFTGQEMQPILTTLVTYDNKGNVIARKVISCQCSAEKVKICRINKSSITVEEYKRVWEQPIDKVSFDENKVKEHQLVAKATFKIDDTGHILNDIVPAGFNDSNLVVQH